MALRLSILMFLNYAVLGSWSPVFGPYLKELGLNATEIAWVFATTALGSLLAPLPWGQIADRWISAEKCISFCALIAGTMLWRVAGITAPVEMFWNHFVFWLFMMPMLSLGSAVTFRHLTHPERQFGGIRMWGTVGWIVAGWLLTVWFKIDEYLPTPRGRDLSDSLRWGAILAWTLSIYAWTLPATPPIIPTNSPASPNFLHRWLDAPLRAAQMFRVPAFALYCVCFFGLYVSWPFNMQMTALLIQNLGVSRDWLPTIMSIAQSTEVLTLGTLPFILHRFGQKGTMILGICSWSLAVIVLAIGSPTALVITSLLLHGLYITCFLVAGQVFVNRIAQHDFRASVQAWLVLINGLGLLVGNYLVSIVREHVRDDYAQAFFPPAIGVALLAALFIIGFHPPPNAPVIEEPTDEEHPPLAQDPDVVTGEP